MSKTASPNYWVFSNKPEGFYGSVWDQRAILDSGKYTIKETEPNRKGVRPGDVAYMRIYGQHYRGKFTIAGKWAPLDPAEQKWEGKVAGQFPMKDVVVWQRPLPQSLVIHDLSSKSVRPRIAKITAEDGAMIETAQRVYARLGFGDADGKIIILEKGLEEAIKPNLKKMGLKLASKQIQQQFDMGPGVGRSDLICLDESGGLVVIELKRGMTSDETIGQVLRYVGWVRENIAAEGQSVQGWIIAGDYDEHLRLAASAADVRLVLVRLG
jgi:hypothetical protein